jgi:hypothetical protein
MKHNKTKKRFISIIVVFSMIITMYGFLPMPNAANAVSMTSAKDTLSDSDLGVATTHTINFTSTQNVEDTDYVQAVLHADFGDLLVGGITCGAGNWAAPSAPNTETARCTANAQNVAGAFSIIIANVDNPSASGTYEIMLEHRDTNDILIESVQVTIAIVDNITMTAHVDATLTFTIDGMLAAETVNGEACTEDTTATTTDFGTLAPDVAKVVCQELTVATNATEGYIVTVQQDDDLKNSAGDTINSFRDAGDGHGTTSPEIWVSPTNTLDAKNEYGHMGLTTEDADIQTLGGYEDYSGIQFAGLDGTNLTVVMHHDGPADGTTADKGLTQVAYKAEVSALQEAGDYISTLTYIATPTY